MKYIIKIAAMTAIMALCATSFAQTDNGNQGGNLQDGSNPQDLFTDFTLRAFFPAGTAAGVLLVKVYWYLDGQLISDHNNCEPIASKTQSWWDTSSPLIMNFWNRTRCIYPGQASVKYYVYLRNFSNQTLKTACGRMDIVPNTNNIVDITTWYNGSEIPCPELYSPGQNYNN